MLMLGEVKKVHFEIKNKEKGIDKKFDYFYEVKDYFRKYASISNSMLRDIFDEVMLCGKTRYFDYIITLVQDD